MQALDLGTPGAPLAIVGQQGSVEEMDVPEDENATVSCCAASVLSDTIMTTMPVFVVTALFSFVTRRDASRRAVTRDGTPRSSYFRLFPMASRVTGPSRRS